MLRNNSFDEYWDGFLSLFTFYIEMHGITDIYTPDINIEHFGASTLLLIDKLKDK